MKLLLDENLPVKLKHRFADNKVNVHTVKDMHWLGKSNGELLNLMIENSFTSFLTIDNNISFQQNFKNYPLQVIVVVAFDNTYETIMQVFENILEALKSSKQIVAVIHPLYTAFK